MKKIIYSLILLTLLFGVTIILAQDNDLPSPGILPDNPFYFLKAWKETIQNFFTFGAENKAKQFLHLAKVRLAEYQKMIEKGKTEIAQKTLDKYEKQLNHALQKIEELKNKGEDIKDISQQLEDTLNKHIEILERNLQKAPEAAKNGLENAIENSSKVLEKIGGKTKKEQSCLDSGGIVTTSLCCKSSGDFPNNCLIGACGCSPNDSHEVKTCDCGEDRCFNGTKCVQAGSITKMGYIKKLYEENSKRYLDFDEIQWLSFTEGTCVTNKEDNPNLPECNPNGFLILNKNTNIETFEVGATTVKKTSEFAYSETGKRIIGYESFVNLGEEHFSVTPYIIKIENGIIAEITEKYIP